MAGHEWDWFQREELIGQISDIRVQNLQVERENVQKRTFTRWINLHLEKCKPPLEVKDLFIDIQDGKILMALLEVLSGQSLLHEYKSSSHRIFRLNNIAKALKFLEDSNVKLVSIDAAEIADGNSSLILGLIWNIILFFQIKELTGNLNRNSSSSSLSSGTPGPDSDSSLPTTPKGENSVALSVKDQRKAIRTLLNWVQRRTRKYGVAVQDFAGSWRSGLAFLAIIKAIDPSLVDIKQALEDSARENLEKAFSVAHDKLHIPRLLEPEDIMVDSPDEQSIVTYVAQFLEHFPDLEGEDFTDPDKEIPIESTFVRIKETPTEQESKIFLLPEKGEHTYTVNCETSQPPPPIVFVCDTSEVGKELVTNECPRESFGHRDPESPKNHPSHVAEQAFPGGLNKPSDINESLSEPSILLPKKAGHRPDSLPIKKTVHFESDMSRDASCSKDIPFKANLGKVNEPVKQDDSVSSSGVSNKIKPREVHVKTAGSALNKILDDYPLTHKKNSGFSTSEYLPGTAERKDVEANKGHDSSPSLEARGHKFIQETLDEVAKFEEMTLKALKQSTEMKGLTGLSQTLHDENSSPDEKNAACGRVSEANVEQLAKKASKCRRKMKDSTVDKSDTDLHSSDMPMIDPSDYSYPASPGKDIYSYIWHLREKNLMPEMDLCEEVKQKSVHYDYEENTLPEDQLETQDDVDDEISTPLSSSVSLETLGSQSEDSLDFKVSPPSSKVSVIPHDLFYYPHYDVPLSAVLEAYVEDSHGSQNEEKVPEKSTKDAQELDAKGEDHQKYCKSNPSYSATEVNAEVRQMAHAGCPAETQPSSETVEAKVHVEHKGKDPPNGGSVDSSQSQDFQNVGKLDVSLPEEARSIKKKEEWSHGDKAEKSLFVAAKAAPFSEDLEEEIIDGKVISRTSHSDSSLYTRRQGNRSSEMDHVSHGRLRSDIEERRNRLLIRKVSSFGEAMLQGHPGAHSDSLVHFAQQQDLVYFILFLWLLVYCLLLFPQLDIKKL
ncbi:calmin isoform X1 [Phascolarctos cinereus]|uniref:Calmin n=1 Tax=Phascolarctos cinereus TaxID=38626 RepID=A0A6P5LUD3_PHACI|nr:calmin isoform X1 [Phascolarctos cinereus]